MWASGTTKEPGDRYSGSSAAHSCRPPGRLRRSPLASPHDAHLRLHDVLYRDAAFGVPRRESGAAGALEPCCGPRMVRWSVGRWACKTRQTTETGCVGVGIHTGQVRIPYTGPMPEDTCNVCGGDGRISNAFGGSTATCPACHGTGRRAPDEGFRDVTKTKPSHYRRRDDPVPGEKQTWPSTYEGDLLAKEVQESANISDEAKAKLVREIIDYEGSHGKCTKTFTRKVRRQLRPPQ